MNQYGKQKILWKIWISFLIVIFLQKNPAWPENLEMFRPSWVLLILIYWTTSIPERLNIGTGFLLGTNLDILTNSPLGIHALSLSIIAYLCAYKSQSFKNLSLLQQSLIVFLLSLLMNLILFLTKNFMNNITFQFEILWNSIINGILWPWFSSLMKKIQRKLLKQKNRKHI